MSAAAVASVLAKVEKAYPNMKSSIAATEVEFETYRAATCKVSGAAYAGGSMQPMIVGSCYVLLNKQRVAILKSQLPQDQQ